MLRVLRPKKRVLRPTFWVLRPILVMLRPTLRVVHHRWSLTGLVGGLFLDSMGGAWPFIFGEVICLVTYFNDRDHSHVSYWITSHKDIV